MEEPAIDCGAKPEGSKPKKEKNKKAQLDAEGQKGDSKSSQEPSPEVAVPNPNPGGTANSCPPDGPTGKSSGSAAPPVVATGENLPKPPGGGNPPKGEGPPKGKEKDAGRKEAAKTEVAARPQADAPAPPPAPAAAALTQHALHVKSATGAGQPPQPTWGLGKTSFPISLLEGGKGSVPTQSLIGRGEREKVVELDCGSQVPLCALLPLRLQARSLRCIRCAATPANLAALATFLAAIEAERARRERNSLCITLQEVTEALAQAAPPATCDEEWTAFCGAVALNNAVQSLHIGKLHLAGKASVLTLQLCRLLAREAELSELKLCDNALDLGALAAPLSEWCAQPSASRSAVGAAPPERRLCLQCCHLHGESLGLSELAAALPACHSLVSLELTSGGIRSDGAILLAGALPRTPNLKSLGLCGNRISDNGALAFAEALSKIVQGPGLTDLNLCMNDIGPAGVEALNSAMWNRLTRGTATCHVQLEGNPGQAAAPAPPAFRDNASGQLTLEKPWCSLANTGNVAGQLRSTPLQREQLAQPPRAARVDCHDPQAMARFAQALAAGQCDGVSRVVLDERGPGGWFVDEAWDLLCDALATTSVETLAIAAKIPLRGTSTTIAPGLGRLFRGAAKLKELRVRHNWLPLAQLLAGVPGFALCLERLYLELPGDGGLQLRGGVAELLLALPRLSTLSLCCSGIGSDGAIQLGHALSSPHRTSLRTLLLAENYISDNGAHALAAAVASTSRTGVHLQELDLRCNLIGFGGVSVLLAALRRRNSEGRPLAVDLSGNLGSL